MAESNKGPDNELTSQGVSRYLELQKEELIIRAEELELRKQEADHNADYARAALDAEMQNQESNRLHQERTQKFNATASTVVILIFALCAFGLAFIGKESILVRLIELFAVGLGCFFWGKHQR